MKRTELLSCCAILLTVLLAGCGTTTGDPSASKLVASQECIGCHSTSTSHVTGGAIVSEWTASAHNTGNGAGCADCHEPAAGHPNNCSRCHGGGAPSGTAEHDVRLNPDADGVCMRKCHGLSFPNDVMVRNAPQHFWNMTATSDRSKRPSYISTMYLGACRKCHNPHDPTGHMKQNRDWAESGHANVASSARSTDFKTRGTYEPANLTFQNYCVRCHTSTGYIRFVTSGFSDLRPFGDPVVQNGVPGAAAVVSPDDTKELTNCDVCHDDGNGNTYSFKLRPVPPVTIYYNISTAKNASLARQVLVKLNDSDSRVDYPNAGPSNICIPCHAGGRSGVGRMIPIAAARFINFSATPSVASPHALPPAQVLFETGGYEFPGRDYSNPAFRHTSIGMANLLGTGTRGPCIACHANTDRPHLFDVVTINSSGTVTELLSRTCSRCHNGGSASGTLLPALSASDLQARRVGMDAALAALTAMNTWKRLSTTNWAKYGKNNGPNMMGAAQNYSILSADKGSYAHNDLYAKRLIYDSIDWLYNGKLDGDVEAAINAIPNNSTTAPTFSGWPTRGTITGITFSPAPTDASAIKAAAIQYLLGGPGGSRP